VPVFDALDEIVVPSTERFKLVSGRQWSSPPWRRFLSPDGEHISVIEPHPEPEFEFPGAFEGQVVQFFIANRLSASADAVLVFAFTPDEKLLLSHNVGQRARSYNHLFRFSLLSASKGMGNTWWESRTGRDLHRGGCSGASGRNRRDRFARVPGLPGSVLHF
jgi:hypothetical protein